MFLERGIPATGFLSDRRGLRAARLLRRVLAAVLDRRRARGHRADRARLPVGRRTARPRRKTTFEGDGGPSVGSVFNRLIYALKFQSEQILFSDYVNEDSQILYDRDPSVRVQKVAPYLELDSDPYPSVVDGRIVWIIDGYTLSANYPYSTTVSLQQAITDSNNTAPRFALDDINYIRNSVKATVDAYDGSVTLYAWDEEDPVLQAWQKVYPSTIKPISEMSGELMSHVRYPTDLFKVQRALLGVYHVDDAQSFYQRDNALGDAERPADRHAAAAAVLPDDADAGSGGPDVLDVHDLHPVVRGRQQPQRADGLPRGRLERRERGGRQERGLRQAPDARDRRRDDDPRPRPGAEHLQLRSGDLAPRSTS